MFSVGVVSPDGQTLYASADFGRKIFAIDTSTFALKRQFTIETPTRAALQVMSIGISPDGARLYAIDVEGKQLVRLDSASGTVSALVKIDGAYAGRILRVVSR
jgi:sugar lactone lactonase YvrE